jgi:hypothetical protein
MTTATTATTATQLNGTPKPEQPEQPAKVTTSRAPRKEQAQAAKKAPAKKAPAKAVTPAKAAKATTPPRDLTKVTAREQSELRESVLRMVWATPLYKYRKDAGIPGEVPDQAVLDAIDVFAKYIHPASYMTKDGKVTRRS